ncbi:hypothetical protein [Fibrella aquatilis]|uniref:Uncharacterized protein n=1 Tax=Fibrella aquatilis TaxID=2817059 RepID=A0A939K076_9BACT|nr:hypothetical protein [Fibrella aquatilis]MBO0933909.1 hypothetical protein [Fibrella aquatilis]
MRKIKLSLRHFFQQQAAEEQETLVDVVADDTTTADVAEADQADDTTTDEVEAESEEESVNPTPEASDDVAPPATEASAEMVREIEMGEADYNALVADAGSWRTNQAELERLRTWHQNAKGGGLLAAADADTAKGGNQSWKQAPWNQ